ncbi:hypothetical protein HPB47_020227 [Ixodes persulcatus]|uniref:Uncharacterized protein n=1 Tax=Ixodes persulcatus TaxID=34615 RepID=A0AC60QG24_IXOPE|nr:hypothetical protein HPB47_020227 [Ixodes persulcatus]
MREKSLQIGAQENVPPPKAFIFSAKVFPNHLHLPCLMHPEQPAACELSAVHFRLPPFWTADPQIWFAQVESQFTTSRITFQVQRFHHVIAALSLEIAAEIRDQVLTPPATSPYDTLKVELIRRTTSSEQRRLRQLHS